MEDADFDRELLMRDQEDRERDSHLAKIAEELAAVKLKVDTQLTAQVADLQVKMNENTAITEQIRDILASFRVMAAIAKWAVAVSAGALALWHGWDGRK